MNISYSKMRHMQNSNLILERRFLIEQTEETLLNQISTLIPNTTYLYKDDNEKGIYTFKSKDNQSVTLNFSNFIPMAKDMVGGKVEERKFIGWNLDSITTTFIVKKEKDLSNEYAYDDYLDIKPDSNVLVSTTSSGVKGIPILYITSDNRIFVKNIIKKGSIAGQ